MQKNQFTNEQIVAILQQAESSKPKAASRKQQAESSKPKAASRKQQAENGEQTIAEVCRQHNISENSFYRWRTRFVRSDNGPEFIASEIKT